MKKSYLIFIFLFYSVLFSQEEKKQGVIEEITIEFIMGADSSKYIVKETLLENMDISPNKFINEQSTSTFFDIHNVVRILKNYLNKAYDEKVCIDIKSRLTDFFYGEGYKFFAIRCSDKKNELFIKVIFAHVGKIIVQGNKYFSKKKILSEVSAEPNEMVDSNKIEKDIFWLNNNPFRSVNIEYTPGDDFGSTDIILNVKDRRLFRIYSGYEMTDNNIAGHSRFFVGANYGNFLSLNQQINYQFIFSPKIDEYYAHSGSYIIPFPWRNFFKVYGNYVHSEPKNDSSQVTNKGRNYTISCNYVIPFVTNETYKHSIAIGYNYQNLNNFFEYYSERIQTVKVAISQFLLCYELINDFDKTTIKFNIRNIYSPGNMTKYNSDKYFKSARAGADSNYFFSVMNIESMVHLKNSWFWFVSAKGQVSSGKLIPTTELSLGGFYSVRGYKENAIIGDYGLILNNELRYTNMRLFKSIKDQVTLLAFLDYGFAKEIDPNLLTRKSSWLMSIGPGLRYNINL